MKLVIIAFLLSLMTAVLGEDHYTTKYDYVEVEDIVRSDRLFKNYFKCLMSTGKCTPEGRELRRTLPDALKTECRKCSEKQKKNAAKVLRYLIGSKPDEWQELRDKYDPEGVYAEKYKDVAEKYGIIY